MTNLMIIENFCYFELLFVFCFLMSNLSNISDRKDTENAVQWYGSVFFSSPIWETAVWYVVQCSSSTDIKTHTNSWNKKLLFKVIVKLHSFHISIKS